MELQVIKTNVLSGSFWVNQGENNKAATPTELASQSAWDRHLKQTASVFSLMIKDLICLKTEFPGFWVEKL